MRLWLLSLSLALLPTLAAAQAPQLGVTRPGPIGPVPEQHLPSTGAPALTQDDPAPALGASLNAGPNNANPFSGAPNPFGAWNRNAPQDTGATAGGGGALVPNVGR